MIRLLVTLLAILSICVSQSSTLPSNLREKEGNECELKEVEMEISQPGCTTKKIKNNECQGMCSSFFLFSSLEQKKYNDCRICKPNRKMIEVALDCRDEAGNVQSKMVQNVPYFESCSCQKCFEKIN